MGTASADPLGLVGTTVDKYDIVSLAGEGGFSVVYRAEHRIWKQPVAIKFFTLLEDAKPTLREQLLEDFVREGKLLSELSSRTAAILQARDIGRLERGEDRWIPYMVLEWLEGCSLEAVLAELRAHPDEAPSLGQSMSLLAPAAQALEVAHEQGIAHRDLKPANLMVVGDWRARNPLVKLLDFGIAKVMGEHEELQQQLQLTGAQVTAFTPAYGAPEQFTRTYGATGPWTDVYALALIVVELMLGGRPALQGETIYDVGRASCDPDTRPTPRSLGLEVSDAVEQVFAKAVARSPADRYATMGLFWSELCQAAGVVAVDSGPGLAAASSRERSDSQAGTAIALTSSSPVHGRTGAPPSGETAPMSRAPTPLQRDDALGAYRGRSSVTPDGPTVAAMLTSVTPPPRQRSWLRPAARWITAGALVATLLGVGAVALTRGSDPPPTAARTVDDGAIESPAQAEVRADERTDSAAPSDLSAKPRDATLEEPAAPPAGARPGTATAAPAQPSASAPPDGGKTGPGASGRVPAGASGPTAPSATATGSSSRGGSSVQAPAVDPWDPSSFGGRR